MNRYEIEQAIRLLVGGMHPKYRQVIMRGLKTWEFVTLDEFTHSYLRLDESSTEPATVEGVTQIWSDGAAIKVKFGDGTVKSFTLV